MSRWWDAEPKVEEHEGIIVVRDDLLDGGSKVRFLSALISGAREVVYGTPFCGGAQVALAAFGQREGIRVTLFTAQRKDLHANQLAAQRRGATLHQVPHGYMSHVQAKAAQYALKAAARLLPLGFDLPEARLPYVSAMKRARAAVGPVDEVWCATGSGMLARCLGLAFPDARIKAVAVGLRSRHGKQAFSPNVELIEAPWKFEQAPSLPCPFPAAAHYERKAWAICQERRGAGRALFWNVAA